jgi:hypothetical protein
MLNFSRFLGGTFALLQIPKGSKVFSPKEDI